MSKILKVSLLLLLLSVAASAYVLSDENVEGNNSADGVDDETNNDNQSEGQKLPQIDDYGETNKCPANQSFKWKCNYCSCGPNGKDAACTKMACLD